MWAGLWRSRVRRRRAARWAAIGVVAGVVLAGCSDPEPVPSPPPPTTQAPEPTPSETPAEITAPERPAEMERTDETGAMAAAEYFMELFAYVMATGDLEEWDRVSGQTCTFCASVREDVERIYSSGGRVAGVDLVVGRTEKTGYEEVLGVYGVALAFSFGEGAELGADGEVAQKLGAEDGLAVLEVSPSTRGWVLIEGSTGPATED